jgi:hypothetical protein
MKARRIPQCGLGSAEDYFTTMCSMIISLELCELAIRIAIYRITLVNDDECGEVSMILNVLLFTLGQLAPVGFAAMTDEISRPRGAAQLDDSLFGGAPGESGARLISVPRDKNPLV